MTVDQLKDKLVEMGYPDSAVIDEYMDAVIGISTDGRVVYSFDLMVQHLMITTEMGLIDATEYVEYNVVRSLPYMGGLHPIIVYNLDEDDE